MANISGLELAQVFDRIRGNSDFHFGRFDIVTNQPKRCGRAPDLPLSSSMVSCLRVPIYTTELVLLARLPNVIRAVVLAFRIGNAAAQRRPRFASADIWRDGRAYYSERDVSLVCGLISLVCFSMSVKSEEG